MNAVELRLGGAWRLDVACTEPRPPGASGGFDLGLVLDTLDVVVDGDNLSARVPRDRILYVLADLLDGLTSLVRGAVVKVILSFHLSPWELVLVRRGRDTVSISLCRVGPRPAVEVHDRPASLSALVREALRIAMEVCAGSTTDLGRHVDPVEERRRLLGSLGPASEFEGASARRSEDLPHHGCSTVGAVTVAHVVDLHHPDLRDYRGDHARDLHALLAPGSMALQTRGLEIPLPGRYPVVSAFGLIADLQDYIGALERQQAGAPSALESHTALLPGARLVSGVGRLARAEVEVGRGGMRLALGELVGATVAMVEALGSLLRSAQPRLSRNRRLGALLHSARELSVRWRLIDEGDIPAETRGVTVDAVPIPRRPRTSRGPRFVHPLNRVRRLIPVPKWRWSGRGVEFASVAIVGGQVVLGHSGGVEVLALDGGASKWSRPSAAGGGLATWLVDEGTLMVVCSSAQIEVMNLATGRSRWRQVSALRRPLGAVTCHELVAVLGANEIVAHGLEDGERRWQYSVELGSFRALASHGDVLVATTEDGFVYGIASAGGSRMWRTRVGVGPVLTLVCHGAVALVTVAVAGAIRLVALDERSGVERWTRTFRGWLAGGVAMVGERFGLTITDGQHSTLNLVDLGGGASHCEVAVGAVGAATHRSAPMLDDSTGLALVRDAISVTAVDPTAGEVRWTRMTADDDTDVLATLGLRLVDGAVVVPGRRTVLLAPQDGAVLHTLDTLHAQPASLDVSADLHFLLGERGEDGEDDVLECFAVEHFLAVVK